MDNQKLENLLNLALDTPNDLREKSLTLNVGYEEETKTWELIVKYNGSLQTIRELGVEAEDLIAGYAILTVPENLVQTVARQTIIEYVEKPKLLFFALVNNRNATCVLPVTIREPYLSGRGTIVAIIDSGIDYTNADFRNPDGSSRILYLWDQTLIPDAAAGRVPPEGFRIGVEFTKEQLDEALREPSAEATYRLVPSRDVSGHGTAVAGIAVGNGRNSNGVYKGMAPESDLIIVKLGIPGTQSFPRTTELMRALTYVVRKAADTYTPLSVNLSFGNTYGPHDGSSLLERFIDNVSEIGRNVICVGAGNEGGTSGHVQGRVAEGTNSTIELAVAQYEVSLNVQLWKSYVDDYRILLVTPGGERIVIPTLQADAGKFEFMAEQTRLLIYYGKPTPYSDAQELYIDFIPVGLYINPGIWTFILEPVKIVTGQYYFYLPSGSVRNRATEFFLPTPELTLTIPSTSAKVITVGAYDTEYDAYAQFSGRGYAYRERTRGTVASIGAKPDLVAPGVNITTNDTLGGYVSVTGTSFAAPFVTGAAALMMEWGIVKGNDPFLYGEKVKAYLRKGASPIRGESEYPNERVGYGALCVSESLPL